MKNVLWISRHEMTPEQFADLERVAGDEIKLNVYSDSVKDIADLKDAISKSEIIAAVLPSGLMSDLWKSLDGQMLVEAASERVATGRTLVLNDGRREKEFIFRHKCWKQILKYDVVSEEL